MKRLRLLGRFKLIAIAIMLGSITLLAIGQNDKSYQELKHERERESLKGVKTVQIMVEKFAPQTGIDDREIQTMVELKLRTIGVKVTNGLSQPLLYINSLYFPTSADRYPFFFRVSLEFRQSGILLRDKPLVLPAEYDIVTWSRVQTASFNREFPAYSASSLTKEFLSRYVDEFCNDYLAANPKE